MTERDHVDLPGLLLLETEVARDGEGGQGLRGSSRRKVGHAGLTRQAWLAASSPSAPCLPLPAAVKARACRQRSWCMGWLPLGASGTSISRVWKGDPVPLWFLVLPLEDSALDFPLRTAHNGLTTM